jgi:hypothetical protein
MPRALPIEHYELREVHFPGTKGRTERGIAIVIDGGPFPFRALEPQIHVGEQQAELVQILDGGERIRGILRHHPTPGDEIVVFYDPEMQGRAQLGEFEVRPLQASDQPR